MTQRPEKWIENEVDLFTLFHADDREGVERNLYKHTNCGAFITFKDRHVLVGSIVEGCDFGTMLYKLTYPFTGRALDQVIEAVETEAKALWTWANETNQETDPPDVFLEYDHLNPVKRIC